MRWGGLLLLGLAVAFASPMWAQPVEPGDEPCELGTARRTLTSSSVQATVYNTGGLFFGSQTSAGGGYLLPTDTGNSPTFAASLWLGGTVGGDLRVAASRWGGWDFFPGPLEDAEAPPTNCSAYDRIYVVSRDDIRRYYQTGEATKDLRDWPYQLGAPVLDGDGVEGNYNLAGGDQPDLIGDQAAWWVMNDASGDHGASSVNGPLGVEVRVLAFVYGQRRATASPVLDQTSFYRYEIINRRGQPIEQMYASLWNGGPLGDGGDDYIGTDSLLSMGIMYNDSNEDAAYGSPPPAIGVQFLQGPIGLANGRDDDFDGEVDEPEEEMRATSGGAYVSGGPSGAQDPGTSEEYYNYMQGLWGDGSPRYEFGDGFYRSEFTDRTTRFHYAGDPVTESFYSEVNTDGNGAVSPQGQRSVFISTGPFRLAPGESTTLLFAFPFGQGMTNLHSVAVMRRNAETLKALQASGFFVGSRVEGTQAEPTFELALSRARPNPSRQPEALLTLPEATPVRATVYDAVGRHLAVLLNGEVAEGETVLQMPGGLTPGTYLLRIEVPGAEETLTFTVLR